jgi:uncharacterized protein
MTYREYGRTGKKVSILGFGGMRFADVDDQEECAAMMVDAAEAGVNYFDTAPAYFGTRSEEVFGKGFAEMRRKKLPFFASTKTSKSTEKAIRTEIEGQLKRLGIPAIDFYHVWCVTSLEGWHKRTRDGVINTFRSLKEEGLIRHIAVSSHLIGDEIRELLDEGVFEGVLFGYSAYNFKVREKAFEAVRARDLGCVVMNPLGGGIIPQNPKIFAMVRTRPDETITEGALRFLFAHDRITCALVGFSSRKEVREAVKAAEGFQPVPELELDRIKAGLGGALEGLCTGCRYCDSCPEGIPIPKLMDAYNHRILYGTDRALTERLSWHWNVPPSEAGKCTQCGRCEGLCTQHLPIIRRLAGIAALGAGR